MTTPLKPSVLQFLLAVDGSSASMSAAIWLSQLASTNLAFQCTALAVQTPLLSGEVSVLAPAEVTLKVRASQAQLVLAQVSDVLRTCGVAHSTHTCMDDPIDALLDKARQTGADAIVMGRRGLGILRSTLLHSISDQMIGQSPLPVIVAGHEGFSQSQAPAPKRTLRVLLALDGSAPSLRAADFAAQLVNHGHGILHVVHVQPSLSLAQALFSSRDRLLAHWSDESGQHDLTEARKLLRHRGIDLQEHSQSSDAPGEAIALLAQQLRCDLIVMGTRGLNSAAGALLGSVAHEVLQNAKVTVALVR